MEFTRLFIANMNSPQLTQKIEQKVLSIIDSLENNAKAEKSEIFAKYYIQLADLYHFEKNYHKEAKILKRFSQQETASNDDLVGLYERIDRAVKLSEIKQLAPRQAANLALVPEAEDKDNISIESKKPIAKRINQSKAPFHTKSHKVLNVCSAYTGRTDNDEIAQLALVLIEITPNENKVKTIDTFVGLRKTKKAVPAKTKLKFGLANYDLKLNPFNKPKVLSLFNQADFIVGHNDTDIERKLLALLIPEVAEMEWHSSQKDIPWGALGFESKKLTSLCRAHGEKSFRSCLDRAAGIGRLLNHLEPSGEQTYFERLYSMPPMKPFVWTPELIKRKNQLESGFFKIFKWPLVAFSIVLMTSGVYFLNLTFA